VKVRFNLYSEQDGTDQLSNLNITDDQYRLLDSIGDNLDLAILPGADSTGYSADEVRYRKTDTIVSVNGVPVFYQEIFVQSYDPDSAVYQVGFSDVGLGNADYIQAPSTANGRVFQWIAPDSITGVRQGRYMPVQKIITPEAKSAFHPRCRVRNWQKREGDGGRSALEHRPKPLFERRIAMTIWGMV
jgi:hypothetical protein